MVLGLLTSTECHDLLHISVHTRKPSNELYKYSTEQTERRRRIMRINTKPECNRPLKVGFLSTCKTKFNSGKA